MSKNNTYQNSLIKKLSSFLLAILLLSIPMVQLLHSHYTGEGLAKTFTTEKSISTPSEKCLVCDYTAHLKDKQILMADLPVLNIPNNVYTKLNSFVYTRIYKFTLQNFTNKGPPSLS